jgi:hypothetical protein
MAYMYKDTESTATSELIPAYSAMASSAGEIIEEPKLAAKASIPSRNVIQLLYSVDQFLGFCLSFSPQSTIFGSLPSFVGSSLEGRVFSSSFRGVGVDHGCSSFGSWIVDVGEDIVTLDPLALALETLSGPGSHFVGKMLGRYICDDANECRC